MTTWIACTMSGRRITYYSREALERAKRRPRKDVIVDSWPSHDGPPESSDARAWDAWRLRRGIAAG